MVPRFQLCRFYVSGNDRLEAERRFGADMKVEVDYLPRCLLDFRATGHYDIIKDQILFVTQGPTSAMRQNLGKGRSVPTLNYETA